MTRIVFFTRPSQDRLDLSACPPSEILRCAHVSVRTVATPDAMKRFPSPVRLVTVSARRAGDTRPCRMLRPDEDADFFRDLRAPSSEMLSGPTADSSMRSKISQRFKALDDQNFSGLGRQRDGLSCLAVEQLLDCGSIRFLDVPLSSSFRLPSRGLLQKGTQALALVAVRPGDADVHADITGNDIGGQSRLDLRELDKGPCNQSALLPLPDFTGRAEFPATAQGILQRAVGLCRDGWTCRGLNPVGIACALRVADCRVTEQGKISGAVKRVSRGFLRREACVDNPPRPLLRLIGNPAQACRALRVAFRVGSLGVILCAVTQHIPAIPILAVPDLLRFAGVSFDLERVGTNYFGVFRHGRLFGFFNFSRGTFQFGEWHALFAHTVGFGIRGTHV